ncbi:MAG: prepilin-type N-terminal cleavage/methylation domain-containing protein [Phycisphaeraceae bacterium]|nr:prepilin-type N-terminal cleavage/methylation domain-containing protein [Phycisphaeraceae bacterium]
MTTPSRFRVGWVLTAIVCAVVASAGAIKLLDLPLFHRVLSQYQVLPPAVAALAAPIVPALELGLCVLWLLGLRTRRVDWSILLLLILVAGTYAVEWSMAGSKSCGCFGRAGPAWLDSGFGAMSKASVLVGLQAAGMKLRSGGRVLAQPSAVARSTTPARAFTLVEVLVCIAVLAVLVALAIPMVGRAAAASRDAKSLANLRTHAQTMLAYTADSRGLFLLRPRCPPALRCAAPAGRRLPTRALLRPVHVLEHRSGRRLLRRPPRRPFLPRPKRPARRPRRAVRHHRLPLPLFLRRRARVLRPHHPNHPPRAVPRHRPARGPVPRQQGPPQRPLPLVRSARGQAPAPRPRGLRRWPRPARPARSAGAQRAPRFLLRRLGFRSRTHPRAHDALPERRPRLRPRLRRPLSPPPTASRDRPSPPPAVNPILSRHALTR